MGIRCEFSCRYTPEQNGVAERKNWSIVEAARAMLEEKSLPKFYWAEAVRTAVYMQNRIGDKVSAHERYFGTKPDLRHLRVFGSIAYVHIPKIKCLWSDGGKEYFSGQFNGYLQQVEFGANSAVDTSRSKTA
jgi:hypothetical protein